jgi:threonine 3-dehydrogenase
MAKPPSTLIMGAAGAVGKRLCRALTERGTRVIACDRMEVAGSLARIMETNTGLCVGGVDVCDADGVRRLFREHADERTTVWNLAAPLSVETALNPALAEQVTIGGMGNVLDAMSEVGARRICFTDSIGSFGATAPRNNAKARWLHDNPTQDPGSDYGRQKRACRELMAEFVAKHDGDSRFAVLPGVLHDNPVWGNGTTEYALDALLAAPHQETKRGLPPGPAYVCPVDPDTRMPMVFVDDLMRGLVALQEADESELREPEQGYCVPGLSFTPNELFAEIRKHHPGFGYRVELNENMNKFANLWPDDLSLEEPLSDLGYAPEVDLAGMVARVLAAHEERNMTTAQAFKVIDADGSGRLSRREVTAYVRKYLVRGREEYSETGQDAVEGFVNGLMHQLDKSNDGYVSWESFSEWNRNKSIDAELWKQVATVEDQLRKQLRELGQNPRV